ncbi:MAG: glycosyltransferase, partial [Anaerolineae bacterium]|nr:glycosyltransferase [Anaerolineae bacterium]
RTPHLYDMHSSLHQQFANSKFGHYGIVVKIFDVLERWVINSCDSMLTIGTDLEERAIAIKPTVKQTRLENLPVHVIEPIPAQHVVSELKCKLGLENKQIVVYTGTFEHYQGLDLLFDSAELAIKKNPDLHFVMVGGKPNQIDERKAQVQEKGLNDYFTFVGAVSPAQTLAYLEMAHMLVSPRTEGLSVPLKIYTYLCSGKPIVATKLLAHTQILNDSNSMLVEPEPEAFAEGILKLIHNPELGRSLGMEGQVIAKKKYSSENYFNRLKQVYQAL